MSFEKKPFRKRTVKNPSKTQDQNPKESTGPQTTRLNKYIAQSGVCSRREADELIKSGKVKVNSDDVVKLIDVIKVISNNFQSVLSQ